MAPETYLNYVMTETNVAAAVRDGWTYRKSDPGAPELWRPYGKARSGKCCSGDISPV